MARQRRSCMTTSLASWRTLPKWCCCSIWSRRASGRETKSSSSGTRPDKTRAFQLDNSTFVTQMKLKTIAEKITHYEPSNFFPTCDPIRNVPNRLCASCSQSLFTLTVIEDFLAKRPVPPSPNTSSRDRPNQNWVRNHNYYSKSSEMMIKNAFLLFSIHKETRWKVILITVVNWKMV